MQFIDEKNFMRKYIERTLVNLQCIESKAPAAYEVTQLLNSFVGLLVLPCQSVYNSIEDSDISPELLGRIQSRVTLCLDERKQATDKNLKNIVRHLRNGICHWRVKFYGNIKIEEIRITDMYINRSTHKEIRVFDAKFDIDLLREFVIEFGSNIKNKHSG